MAISGPSREPTAWRPPADARLADDGIQVVDVPAKLAARVRLLSVGHGRKNDDADALSVGIAALNATHLNTVSVDAAITALRAIVEHREDLITTRTQTINRLHVLLTRLTPGGLAGTLTANRAAQLLRSIRPPRDAATKVLRGLAVDMVVELRHLDRRICKTDSDIESAVKDSGTQLTTLHGIGITSAAKILSRVGPFTGSAPQRHLRPTPAPHPSKSPPARSPATGSPARVIANSTPASTLWR